MGLHLRPAKCRTLSLSGRCVSDVKFFLRQAELENISAEPIQFLGTWIPSKSHKYAANKCIQIHLTEIMNRVERLSVRGECILWIYNNYVTACMRFLLTVHDLSKFAVEKLEKTATRFIEKWLKLPRCAKGDSLFTKSRRCEVAKNHISPSSRQFSSGARGLCSTAPLAQIGL